MPVSFPRAVPQLRISPHVSHTPFIPTQWQNIYITCGDILYSFVSSNRILEISRLCYGVIGSMDLFTATKKKGFHCIATIFALSQRSAISSELDQMVRNLHFPPRTSHRTLTTPDP